MKILAVAILLAVTVPLAAAGKMSDAQIDARAHALDQQLRCVVCQGESLDESNATLAADLRNLIRTRIASGQNDEQIKAFLVQRYGAFILMTPPVAPSTYLLWFGPAALLLIGGLVVAGVVFHARRPG
ncbi:MAG TPA: cytochrome c-type biogenesis protein [Rhizomicrobium sp.]|jgi:cytochrome c-type biogenesis protein CcmH|nr:cytochrome c-type biogenesis protein [Rhizomicrobium sp.]